MTTTVDPDFCTLLGKAELYVLEFNIKKHAGAVHVQGVVTADEGKAAWQQRL